MKDENDITHLHDKQQERWPQQTKVTIVNQNIFKQFWVENSTC